MTGAKVRQLGRRLKRLEAAGHCKPAQPLTEEERRKCLQNYIREARHYLGEPDTPIHPDQGCDELASQAIKYFILRLQHDD